MKPKTVKGKRYNYTFQSEIFKVSTKDGRDLNLSSSVFTLSLSSMTLDTRTCYQDGRTYFYGTINIDLNIYTSKTSFWYLGVNSFIEIRLMDRRKYIGCLFSFGPLGLYLVSDK